MLLNLRSASQARIAADSGFEMSNFSSTRLGYAAGTSSPIEFTSYLVGMNSPSGSSNDTAVAPQPTSYTTPVTDNIDSSQILYTSS